ncbi:unnamed protein product [Polarella glacialis]|uniref:Uncharacterized protein n=1 Tax=Polarella glacialis TaxID=89957 RepID=A0A813E1H9_POLGL|nr:unnamed protein product [Polarella glacialis]
MSTSGTRAHVTKGWLATLCEDCPLSQSIVFVHAVREICVSFTTDIGQPPHVCCCAQFLHETGQVGICILRALCVDAEARRRTLLSLAAPHARKPKKVLVVVRHYHLNVVRRHGLNWEGHIIVMLDNAVHERLHESILLCRRRMDHTLDFEGGLTRM